MSEIRKITLQFPSLRAFLSEYGQRICGEGMLLRGEAPPAAGSTVDIEVNVTEGMRLLRVRGETVWSGAAGGQRAASVRFEKLDEASRTLIGKIVEHRRREGAPVFSLDDVPGSRQGRPRDLTVPASADPALSSGSSTGSVFDLAQPPATEAADLFSPAGADEPALPPAAAEEPGTDRPPPVPLLDDSEPQARSDLSDLFGGDEPEVAPAGGHTEAFPPSFVDEVEAELEATDTTEPGDGSFSVVDTGELEARLGVPVGEPGPDAETPFEVVPAAEPEPQPETASVSEPEPEVESEPEPVAEASAGPEAPAPPEASLPEARAFNVGQGPETVEIPITDSSLPAGETPAATESAAAVGESPPVVESPPPPVESSPPPEDDNLLAIPELGADPATGATAATPEVPMDLPTSAESLRGAASRSQHVGTWLLIVLLVSALAVAGYFLLGMLSGGGPMAPAAPATGPVEPAAPAGPADAAPEPVGGEVGPPAAAEEAEPQASGSLSGEPVPVEPEPAAPLTGLNRITWSESSGETILALIGDGEIPRRQIELAPIAGDQPRLVIRIAGVRRPFQPAVLEVGTSHVRRVRTGLQAGGGLHVVVDLAVPGVSVRDLSARGSRIEVHLGVD